MTSLTITRLTDETAEIRNERNQTATLRVYSDGSSKHIAGAAWLLKAAEKDLGARPVRRSLMAAMVDGSATVN